MVSPLRPGNRAKRARHSSFHHYPCQKRRMSSRAELPNSLCPHLGATNNLSVQSKDLRFSCSRQCSAILDMQLFSPAPARTVSKEKNVILSGASEFVAPAFWAQQTIQVRSRRTCGCLFLRHYHRHLEN